MRVSKKRISSSTPTSQKINSTGCNEVYVENHNGFMTIYKPYVGEKKRMRGTIRSDVPYYKREILAYELNCLFHWNIVPITVETDGHKGIGSRQLWVKGKINIYFDDDRCSNKVMQGFARMSFFDIVIGNTDRHAANWLVDFRGGKVWAIDNGLCFPTKLDEIYFSIISSFKIRENNYSEFVERWLPLIQHDELEYMKTIGKRKFLNLFRKFDLEKEGKLAWERLQTLLSLVISNEESKAA